MEIEPTKLVGVWIITPKVFHDTRGYFMETFQRKRFEAISLRGDFVQDNHSCSTRNTLRGLHFQNPQGQV